MKNNILFVGRKKLSKKHSGLENDFNFRKETNPVKAYKSLFANVPDVVVLNLSDFIFESYHFAKLLKMNDNTKNIPIVVMVDKCSMPEKLECEVNASVSSNSEYSELVNTIKDVVKKNKISDSIKTKIESYKYSEKQFKADTAVVLNDILMSSSIVDEFKPLINNIGFETVLSENIFKIIGRYLSFDIAGLFFNNSDETKRNVLHLSIPNHKITLKTVDVIRDKFFDEIEKNKCVNEIQCDLVSGDVSEKGKADNFKKVIILPYKSGEQLSGGIVLAFKKEPDLYQNMFLNVILRELEVVFNIAYLFSEQASHALYDTMTGLFNKQEFEANLEKEFHRARRYIFNFTLAMIDIDYLSRINEQYGKSFGDFVITELSRLLKEVFRRTDLIYRYGGEEIIVFLPSTPITKSIIPIERLRTKIANHVFEKDGHKTNVTVSIGLCANYSKFTEPEQLLEAVGESLLRAKDGGRNKVDIFE